MKLSKRLKLVADYVTPGSILADIGTDHAYIPIYLFQHKIIPKALALDINRGPIMHAKTNIVLHDMAQYIETRLSDGFEKLVPGEADSVVIAGMGGRLITKILSDFPHITKEIKEFILQPQSELAFVRCYLRNNNFIITDENMVLDEGKYYTVLHVIHGDAKSSEDGLSVDELAVLDQYGEHLINKKHPVFRSFLLCREQQLLELQKRLCLSANEETRRRIYEIKAEHKQIGEVLLRIERD